MIRAQCPVLGFAAWSGTGKTTLLKQLMPLFTKDGLNVALIKHAHHTFDIDHPGKDSYELRKAGAQQVLIASQKRWALMVETPESNTDPDLQTMLNQFDQTKLDLILVEGFKHETFTKIELHRREVGKPLLFHEDPHIIAIATDPQIDLQTTLPILNINEPVSVYNFIRARMLQLV